MPYTDRKLELKAKTSMARTASQAAVYGKGLKWVITRQSQTSGTAISLSTAVEHSFMRALEVRRL
jgi:hypothetical protein